MYCIEIITNHNHTNECNQNKKKKKQQQQQQRRGEKYILSKL